MPKWEYNFELFELPTHDLSFGAQMDKYGAEGWELVLSEYHPRNDGMHVLVCTFKRSLPE